MNPYSVDLRKKIVEALRRGTTKSEAARSFGVSRSSVKRYAKLADEGRPLTPKKRPGSKPKMDESARRLLEVDLEERPAATLSGRREFLEKVAGVRVGDSTVSRMLRRLGWSRKKIAGSSRARRVPESGLACPCGRGGRRQAGLVFVDEMGANVSLSGLYVWSRRSKRAFAVAPRGTGARTSRCLRASPADASGPAWRWRAQPQGRSSRPAWRRSWRRPRRSGRWW